MPLKRIIDSAFRPAARYPADPRAVFILLFSVFSGLTSLALSNGPQSLELVLPYWAVATWGVVLCLGSAITLLGMLFQSLNGIITEQIGSVMIGAAATFYPVVALYVVGPGALQSVTIIFAWGLACFWRWGQLQVLIHDAHQRQLKIEMLNRVHAEIAERERREAARARAEADRRRRS
jgi:hypothetical protein